MGFRRQVRVLRTVGGHYDDDGMWQEGMADKFTILASVQPLRASDEYVNLQPEGASRFNAIKIYSDEPLFPAKQEIFENEGGQEADIVIWRNRRWKIVHLEEWQSGVISHYKMVAWEVEPDEDRTEEVSS